MYYCAHAFLSTGPQRQPVLFLCIHSSPFCFLARVAICQLILFSAHGRGHFSCDHVIRQLAIWLTSPNTCTHQKLVNKHGGHAISTELPTTLSKSILFFVIVRQHGVMDTRTLAADTALRADLRLGAHPRGARVCAPMSDYHTAAYQ